MALAPTGRSYINGLLPKSSGVPLRERGKISLTQSPPQLNSPACGVNSTGQAAPQRKSDRINRIDKMSDFYILEHNNPDNPVNPVKTDSLHFLRLCLPC